MAVVVGSGGEETRHHSSCTCALIGDSDRELHILFTLCKEETCCGGLNVPETENCLRSDASRHGLEERSNDYIVTILQRSEVRSNPRTKTVSSQTPCQTVAVYSREAVAPRLSWDADRAWWLRLHSLLLACGRLRMLMAWCSTLGGAHSSLGEDFAVHARHAGLISQQQLVLAGEMGDPLMAARCKLYTAFSLLQRGKRRQAAKIIREQYQFITEEAVVRDPKLITMCQAAWVRLKHLKDIKALKRSLLQHQEVEIQEES